VQLWTDAARVISAVAKGDLSQSMVVSQRTQKKTSRASNMRGFQGQDFILASHTRRSK